MDDEHPPSLRAAKRLHELRRQQGLSAQALADRCTPACPTLTRGTIAKIETGVRQRLTVEELHTLAHALGVQPDDLTASTVPDAEPDDLAASTVPVVARVNVVLSPDAAVALDKLQSRTGSKKVDLVNRAVMLLEFVDAAQRAGETLIIRKPNGTQHTIRFL